MFVLVFILSLGNGYVQVQAMNYVYPTMKECKDNAVTIRENLMLSRPSDESTVQAYCTEIPVEVQLNMSLEKEAKDFVSRRHDHFKEGVQERIEALDRFITANLYHTTETREAIKHLMIVQMWAERSARLNGVKK